MYQKHQAYINPRLPKGYWKSMHMAVFCQTSTGAHTSPHMRSPAVPQTAQERRYQVKHNFGFLGKCDFFCDLTLLKSLESRKRSYKSISTAAQSRNFNYSHENTFIRKCKWKI